MSLDLKGRFVVLDIETTGITYEYFDEPTEIAMIEIIDGKFTGIEKHYYLKPRKTVTKNFLKKVFGKNFIKELKAKNFDTAAKLIKEYSNNNDYSIYSKEQLETYLHEISHVNEMVDNMYDNIYKGKSKYKVLPEVRDFISDSVVIAHNAKFDVNFLNYWFNSLGLPLILNYICTLNSFKNYFNFKENNLGACCDYYKIELNGAHNALEDTKACADLFLKEVEEFPNDICFYEFNKYEAYANFKKRVLNTNYCQFAKAILSDSCKMPLNIESLGDIEINYCKSLFFRFQKPIDVAKITGLDLGSIEAIFIDWVNCININKHQDLLKDRYLLDTIKEILNVCNNDMDLVNKCCNLLFDNDANYFYFKLVDKLENKKDSMDYDLDDFEFYFVNMRDLEALSKKINKDLEYIYKFLLLWINIDNSRYLKYKQFFKDYYRKNPKTSNQIALYNAIEVASNKSYILKQLGIF